MYKITLWDNNMPSCTSGTFYCFCDNIDDFEEEWLKLEHDKEAIERFERSKAGEIVTDYYSDNPELNIVQYDADYEVYFEKNVELIDCKVDVYNGFRCKSELLIDRCDINVRYIKFKDKFFLIAKYLMCGVCREVSYLEKEYATVKCYGNPVIKSNVVGYKESSDRCTFSDDVIESFVYYPVDCFDSIEELKADYNERLFDESFFGEDELNWLFTDIPGEAG